VGDTNELQAEWVDGGRLDLILDIIAADTTTDIPTLIADVPTVAEFNARTVPTTGGLGAEFTAAALALAPTDGAAPTVEQIRAEMDSNSTQLAAIVGDTNELQAEWVDGGRLDLILDIIAADTTTDIPTLIADVPTVAEFNARTVPTTGGLGAEFTAAALALAPTDGAAPTVEQIRAEMDSNSTQLAAIKAVTDALTAASAAKLAASADTMILGTVQAGTLSTTQATTNISLTDVDQLKGRIIIFRSTSTTAGLRYQATDITGFTVAGGLLTFTAITRAPVAGDTFVIV
jgi:hypothetical protein